MSVSGNEWDSMAKHEWAWHKTDREEQEVSTTEDKQKNIHEFHFVFLWFF